MEGNIEIWAGRNSGHQVPANRGRSKEWWGGVEECNNKDKVFGDKEQLGNVPADVWGVEVEGRGK